MRKHDSNYFEGGVERIKPPKIRRLKELKDSSRFRPLEDSGEHHKEPRLGYWEDPSIGARRK